jgi:hypothetical protein
VKSKNPFLDLAQEGPEAATGGMKKVSKSLSALPSAKNPDHDTVNPEERIC